MLVVLEISLIFLAFLSYYLNGRRFLNPSFIFVSGFIFSIAWAIAYSSAWKLNLGFNTFCVLLGGALEFVLVSYLIHCCTRRQENTVSTTSYEFRSDKKVSNFKFLIAVGICGLLIILNIREITRIAGTGNLSSAINIYRNIASASGEHERISGLLYYPNIFLRAFCYWLSFYIGRSIGLRKFPKLLSIVAMILCMIFSILTGGRNDLFCIALTIIVVAIITGNYKAGKVTQILNSRIMIGILIIGVLGLIGFAYLTSIIGRNVQKSDFLYYVGLYCGASIKNLDAFLALPVQRSEIFGKLTFINMVKWVGARFNISVLDYSIVLPYNYIDSKALGNVYTTYHSVISDFGYFGVPIVIAIIAFISQTIFEKAMIDYPQKNIFMIIYCFICGTLAFSFFSNKFCENVIDINFLKYVIAWIIIDTAFFGFEKIKLVIKQ